MPHDQGHGRSKDKNKDKSADASGWCTEDLYFDENGCLYVANAALAVAIQASLNAWGGHFCMSRETFEWEKSVNGGPIEGNKANMMCPC